MLARPLSAISRQMHRNKTACARAAERRRFRRRALRNIQSGRPRHSGLMLARPDHLTPFDDQAIYRSRLSKPQSTCAMNNDKQKAAHDRQMLESRRLLLLPLLAGQSADSVGQERRSKREGEQRARPEPSTEPKL